jgi:selenocysteine lyase/cysteine desulfurase
MHHLDNAATTHPKPPAVAQAVADAITQESANPRRGSGSGARRAGRLLEDSRRSVASFFGLSDSLRLAFTLNATDALNLAIKGLVGSGGRVLVSPWEHSSVMRPLRGLAQRENLRIDTLATDGDGRVRVGGAVAEARGADLVVLTCASNVTGVLQPWREVSEALGKDGPPLLLDAAQAAGSVPIDFDALGSRTAMAFTGHKALLGPMGCGGLLVGSDLEIAPWREGGTGEAMNPLQPREMPSRLEAGTPPLPAIAGLAAGIAWWREQGPDVLRRREARLGAQLRERLAGVPGLSLLGPPGKLERVPLATFRLEGYSPSELESLLDAEFRVSVRAGLHCARDAHERLGTLPAGAVRASLGPLSVADDIDALITGLEALAAG